jgi:hypothetical protein
MKRTMMLLTVLILVVFLTSCVETYVSKPTLNLETTTLVPTLNPTIKPTVKLTPSPKPTVKPTKTPESTPTLLPTPVPTPTKVYDTKLHDVRMEAIDVYTGNSKSLTYELKLVKKDWQSDYWDLAFQKLPKIFKMEKGDIVDFAYRYEIFQAKGKTGGETFACGLAIPPVSYYFGQGLTTSWQTFVIDLINRDPTYIYQVGFEYGPNWTTNKVGTIFYIRNIMFSNKLPETPYFFIDKEGIDWVKVE